MVIFKKEDKETTLCGQCPNQLKLQHEKNLLIDYHRPAGNGCNPMEF